MSRRAEWAAVTLVLLLAAALRFGGLGQVPPGLAHDEVANGLIARDILAGRHAIYFTAAYGHEPLYQYVQAASVALFGGHWLGLRWPSVAFGLLGIAGTYALARRLFGVRVALLTIAWLAGSFWPLFLPPCVPIFSFAPQTSLPVYPFIYHLTLPGRWAGA
jgi:4-amino-4-deoxy-L-arabinose transferase-like glycosyltransferase